MKRGRGRPPNTPDELQQFSNRVAKLMTEQNLRGKELAAMLNIGEANISRYTHGQRIPGGKQLVELAQALNTTAEYLIFG